MKKRFIFVSIFLILFSFIIKSNKLSDFDYDKLPEADSYFYVYDESNILSDKAKEFIINHSNELYQKTGVQIVVAVVNDLKDLTIENYSTRLFEKWEIGDKKDQGLLFVIKPKTVDKSGEVRIEVGYGLTKIIPAIKADQIIRNYMIPDFKDENMEAGIINGYERSIEIISDYLGVKIEGINPYTHDDYDSRRPSIAKLLLFLFIIFILTRTRGIGPLLWILGSGNNRRGGFGGGFGGGFSGGGGRSGGSGASGKW